jgi:hypothetical protein
MSQQDKQPGATWQATWINLINIANSEYLFGNYSQAWRTLGMLFAWLPKICKADCQKQFDEVNTQLIKLNKSTRYNYEASFNAVTRQTLNYLAVMIPIFSATIQNSLEDKKWIHKEGGYGGVDVNKELEDL